MPTVLAELNALYTHPDLPQTDYTSPAAFRFWLAHSAQMPLLATIAQIALVSPMVTTAVENTFGILGAFLYFCGHTIFLRRHTRPPANVAHVAAGVGDATRR
jgi:hypothetical protein